MTDGRAAIAIIFVLILTGVTLLISQYEEPTPAPVVEIIEPEPKQSPYVIYIFVCDKIEAVIVTSEPPMSSDTYHDSGPSAEMLDLMFEAQIADRVLTFNGGRRFCQPTEII